MSEVSGVKYHRLVNSDAKKNLSLSWAFLKLHYQLLFFTSMTMLVAAMALSSLPWIGVLASLPLTYLSLGEFYVIRKLLNREPTRYSDLFRAFQDEQWMRALVPIALINVAFGLAQKGVAMALPSGGPFTVILGVAIALMGFAITAFSAPLIAFQNKSLGESIDLNIKATTENWQPLLVLAMFIFGIVTICTILLFLPLFFIAFPLLMNSGYFVYAAIFEGLNLDAVEAEIASRAEG